MSIFDVLTAPKLDIDKHDADYDGIEWWLSRDKRIIERGEGWPPPHVERLILRLRPDMMLPGYVLDPEARP